jgi:FtsZ-binding cell division protein ZapB
MGEVNSKSTKAELLEHIKQQDKELKALKANRYDPKQEAESKRIQDAKARIAEEKSSLNEMMDNIITGLQNAKNVLAEKMSVNDDLDISITDKRKELNDLYNLESEYLNTVAVLNAKAEMLDAYEGKITQAKEELANQLDSNKKVLERTEAEYQYNIERQHKMENDDWEDVKSARESALRAREELMNDRDAALKDLEESLNQRELAMKEQLAQAEKQIADAQEKGKLEAEAEYNAKVKLMEIENQHKVEMLESKFRTANDTIATLNQTIETLNERLDQVTQKNQELAEKVVSAMSVKAPVYNVTSEQKK